MPYVENFSEFAARQGCEYLQVQNTEFLDEWIFRNGARCIKHKVGIMKDEFGICEPPTEKFALLRAQRLFVSEKLGQEAKGYQATLKAYQEQANNAVRYPDHCPPVPKGAMESLRLGWDVVENLRVELEQLDQQLTESPEGILARQRQQFAERNAATGRARQRTANEFASLSAMGPPPTRNIVEEVGEYLQSNK